MNRDHLDTGGSSETPQRPGETAGVESTEKAAERETHKTAAELELRKLPILYSFRRCPYAMRARLALTISNSEVEHREVELRDRPAALYAASPKGTVPVLVLPSGEVIDESLRIMDWALGNSDPESWLPKDGPLRETTARLIAHCDGDFKFHLDRYKYANRYADREDAQDPIEHRTKASLLLHELNQRLSDSAFILGKCPTQVDMAIAPFVRQFAFADRAWFDGEPWNRLRHWLDAFTSSELFASVMHKHPTWQG